MNGQSEGRNKGRKTHVNDVTGTWSFGFAIVRSPILGYSIVKPVSNCRAVVGYGAWRMNG